MMAEGQDVTEKIEVLAGRNGIGWDVVAGEQTYVFMTRRVAERAAASAVENGAGWLAANLIGFPTEVVRRANV